MTSPLRVLPHTLVASMCMLAILAAGLRGEERPNIVLILVDDLGYGDLACYGAADMRTPNLDKLMAAGLRFNQFYANCTVCSPTRASLLTGRYPDKAGVPGVIRQWEKNSWGYLDPSAATLPELLKTAGYNTGMVGKWHLGFQAPNTPNDRGFDFFQGFLGDMMDDYWTHRRGGQNWMRRNRQPIEPEGHATDLFTEWSIEFIKRHSRESDSPFFLYLAYNAPHFPIQPPPEWLTEVRKREPQLEEQRAANVAFIEHLDHGIGRVLAAVDEAGIRDETLVIFSSDNGGSLPHAQRNLPLRGGKQSHWEGGIRVPTCVVWPGKIRARHTQEIGMTMDFLPTLCDIAGVEVEEPIDGRSLKQVWLHHDSGAPERTLIWVRREGGHYAGRPYYAIRQGRWKMLQNGPFEEMQLVDLEADPHEENPMPAEGAIAKELRDALMRHIQSAGRVPWQE